MIKPLLFGTLAVTQGWEDSVAGVGFVLGEVYKATHDAKYRDGMRKSVEILQRTAIEKGAGIEWTPVTDIISGAAGVAEFEGAAGIGAWLVRLDGLQQKRESSLRFPDLPF